MINWLYTEDDNIIDDFSTAKIFSMALTTVFSSALFFFYNIQTEWTANDFECNAIFNSVLGDESVLCFAVGRRDMTAVSNNLTNELRMNDIRWIITMNAQARPQ